MLKAIRHWFKSVFAEPSTREVKFDVIHGDITKQNFDCIVNAANTHLAKGGGVCGSIYKAAGPDLELETDQLLGCAVGECKATYGYDLCKHIVHTVGPIYADWSPEEAEWLLRSAYAEAIILADDLRCSEIAFPLISTGIYGYPLREGIQVALEVIDDYITDTALTNINKITIVCFTKEDYDLVKEIHTTMYNDQEIEMKIDEKEN